MRQVKLNVGAALAVGICLLVGGVASPAWAAASATTSEQTDLARYEKYAEAPVASLTYFQTDRFQYLAPDKLAVWLHPNRGLYLLTVATPCTNLRFTNTVGLTSSNHITYAGSDFVTFGSFEHLGVQRCKIVKIVPVDVVKMRRSDTKAKAAASAAGSR